MALAYIAPSIGLEDMGMSAVEKEVLPRSTARQGTAVRPAFARKVGLRPYRQFNSEGLRRFERNEPRFSLFRVK